jgi:glycosyltransferase involved in cell wall biosynthesis
VATTWEAFVAARAVLPGVPALVALDGTPRNALELPPLAPARLPRRVVKLAVERAASARLRHEVGRGPARFLPMSRWAARSLARDYGVRPDHAEPMHTPIDTAWWTPGPGASAGGPPDLLFVGNDFARKGGETLLAAYERFLAPDYTLTVVSTDAVLRGRPLPAGVTLVPGITGEPLRALYRRAACFVLPTLRDHSPWVVAEAQAAGLPVVTADVGGVGDLVVEAETGFVLPRGSPPEAWARAVRAAVDDRSRHAAMREAARRHAEAAFGLERFHARVRAELGALLAG